MKMLTLIDRILGRARFVVKENERVIALYKGEILGIFGPGEHALPNRHGRLEVVRHDIGAGQLVSVYEKALFDRHADIAARHLLQFRTGRGEIAVIERDGAIHAVLAPEKRLAVWKDSGPWTEIRVDAAADLAVDPLLLRRLGQAKKTELLSVHAVSDGQAGLMFVDGAFQRILAPGVHGFWSVGRMLQVKIVDLKRQSLEVAGQELLTRDRVTIRVNVSAEYRVTDPLKAVTAVKDFSETFYRSLQFAFRKSLGSQTLDQILEKKALLDEEGADKVRAEMAEIGIEVFDIALKDVILPGEMREILNQVVAAEKQAEANVIRRREETNATRSLLNTAKVMAENPVMLRLKELEALEAIAGKVEKLTVHNGTGGLLNDLVRLRD
jgi:regulator of protease activity HflC (stomatin/prohibitin superfamily)